MNCLLRNVLVQHPNYLIAINCKQIVKSWACPYLDSRACLSLGGNVGVISSFGLPGTLPYILEQNYIAFCEKNVFLKNICIFKK